jgi:hypothetical protein
VGLNSNNPLNMNDLAMPELRLLRLFSVFSISPPPVLRVSVAFLCSHYNGFNYVPIQTPLTTEGSATILSPRNGGAFSNDL